MRPGIIDGSKLTRHQARFLWLFFLQPNGVRHFVPEDARILIRGRWMDVPTFDIERIDQHPHRHRPRRWRPWRARFPGWPYEIPVKIRTYRIRHEINWEELEYLAFVEKQGWL